MSKHHAMKEYTGRRQSSAPS